MILSFYRNLIQNIIESETEPETLFVEDIFSNALLCKPKTSYFCWKKQIFGTLRRLCAGTRRAKRAWHTILKTSESLKFSQKGLVSMLYEQYFLNDERLKMSLLHTYVVAVRWLMTTTVQIMITCWHDFSNVPFVMCHLWWSNCLLNHDLISI